MYQIKKEFYFNLRKIENYQNICKLESLYFQHGSTTVHKHSRNVAYYSLLLAKKIENKFNIKFNYNNLIIGAFLHDLFLYDWHEKDKTHKLHGYKHPIVASNNAKELCHIYDEDILKIIRCHMWPLTITKIPNSKEAIIVCIIDKILAINETFTFINFLNKIKLNIIHEN